MLTGTVTEYDKRDEVERRNLHDYMMSGFSSEAPPRHVARIKNALKEISAAPDGQLRQ
jgi:hypothetical protein